MKNLLPVSSTLLLVGALAAQPPLPLYPSTTRGITPAWSGGVVFSGNDTQIGRKEAGLPATVNHFNSPRQNVPEYRAETINGWFSALAGRTTTPVAFKGISSGNDAAPLYFSSTGEYWIGQGQAAGYAYMLLSVQSTMQNGGYNGLFGYYFDNPSFPRQLRSGVYYEILPGELHSGTTTVPANAAVGGLDMAMGLIDASDGRPVLGVVSETARMYFVLSRVSAAVLQSELGQQLMFDDGTHATPYTGTFDGTTIFVAEFDPGTGRLLEILVHRDGAMLGIAADEQIDALAVSVVPGTAVVPASGTALTPNSMQYILSTEAATTRELEQLFVVATPTGAGGPRKGRFRTNNGSRLVGTGGTLTDVDVTGHCNGDPDFAAMGGVSFGEPETPGPTTPVGMLMGLSLHARTAVPSDNPNGNDMFALNGVVSGWGAGTPQSSLVYLVVDVVNVPAAGTQSILIPGTRSATQNTFSFDWPFDLQWVASTHQYRFRVIQLGLVTSTINVSIAELMSRMP